MPVALLAVGYLAHMLWLLPRGSMTGQAARHINWRSIQAAQTRASLWWFGAIGLAVWINLFREIGWWALLAGLLIVPVAWMMVLLVQMQRLMGWDSDRGGPGSPQGDDPAGALGVTPAEPTAAQGRS